MYYIPFENRRLSRDFDRIVDLAATTLQHPRIVAGLGEATVARLARVNTDMLLPNIRHGRAFLPKDYQNRDTGAVLLPVRRQQASQLVRLVEPVSQVLRLQTMPAGEVYSPGSQGMVSSAALLAGLRRSERYTIPTTMPLDGGQYQSEPNRRPKTGQKKPMAAAQTLVNIQPSSRETAAYWFRSMPIEVVFQNNLAAIGADDGFLAGVTLHEYRHIDFLHEHGPLYTYADGAAAAEAAAYYVQASVNVLSEEGTYRPRIEAIDTWRQDHANPAKPFDSTPQWLEYCVRNGLIDSGELLQPLSPSLSQ
jgi:hypothetical protein